MTATPEILFRNVEPYGHKSIAKDLGGASMYFTLERTEKDKRMEQALNELAWAELAAHAGE